MQRLSEKANFQITAYESALIELKMNLRREREQNAMEVAEYQSALLNMVPEKKYVDQLIVNIENGIVLRNTLEARGIINKLHKIVKGMHEERTLNTDTIAKQQHEIKTLEDRVFLKEQYYFEEQKLRQFYQKHLLALMRGSGMFKDNKAFKSIFESEDDLSYQKQIQLMLDHIDISGEIQSHISLHLGQKQNLEQIQKTLNKMPSPVAKKKKEH